MKSGDDTLTLAGFDVGGNVKINTGGGSSQVAESDDDNVFLTGSPLAGDPLEISGNLSIVTGD